MLVKSQVKYIQSLSQKKLRDETQLFIAEGPKIINEFLRSTPGRLHQLYATATWLKANDELVRTIPGDRIIAIDEKELESISTLSTPNEVVAILRQPERQRSIELKDTVTLMLDSIQDPGNLGTIIRCADWF
ncbi:MAG: RNA methyltransferase, partial [Chitinophagaceae bacterium]|nr:RNA methyltransferase [Chitinophagaceae bacterium]